MFSGRAESKIISWRDFRNQLTNWPEDIELVAKKWALAPQVNNYLSFDNSNYWPDAWSLINDGMFCDISIALGMFYTLYYSSYTNKDNMRIECYKDQKHHEMLNLVSLEDGKYMLNYHQGRSVNILSLNLTSEPMHIVTYKDLPIKN
jgi:hypothetical protein